MEYCYLEQVVSCVGLQTVSVHVETKTSPFHITYEVYVEEVEVWA